MVVRTKVTVAGVEVIDYKNLKVMKSQATNNSSSKVVVMIDSPFGRHSTTFSVGNTIEVFADKDADPTTKIFSGIVERRNFRGKDTTQTVELTGRDFTLRLQDATVEPIVFTDSEISTIVKNIIDTNVPEITTTNVDVTDVTLPRIAFNQLNVFDAFKKLAQLAGFIFFVDDSKDLHFQKKDNVSSGITLDNTNILSNNFNTTRERMANSIWVYGDRQLAGFREEFLASDAANGSVFTLVSKPHNVEVQSSDTTVPSAVISAGSFMKGGIEGLSVGITSGPDYLINFHDKQIIFQSGTDIAYDSKPKSTGSIVVTYQREIPIVKFGENRPSIAAFGKKVKVINDKTIKDPNTAVNILKQELLLADPFRGMEIEAKGWFANIVVGNTVKVVLSDFNIDETVGIINVTYTFDKNTMQNENIIKFRLDKKILDLTDELVDLRRRLDAIESADRQDTDILTRLEQTTGSYGIIGSFWAIKTRSQGSSFILGNQTTGSVDGVAGIILGTLGSSTGSVCFLGDSRSAFTVQASGGNFA